MLDVRKLRASVEPNGAVFMHLGPVGINVCDHPDEFEEFIETLVLYLQALIPEVAEVCDCRENSLVHLDSRHEQ